MITIDAIGLDKATGQAAYIKAAIAAYGGCYYRGSTRNDIGGTNAAVVEKLKVGPPRRDIKTLSDENAEVIATAWQNEVMRKMDNMTDSAAAGGAVATINAQQIARAQSAAGFREAAKVVLRMLRQRIMSNLSADDSGGLSPAPKVNPGYAAARQARFGVSPDEVYKASGQLLNDMDPSNAGQIVLVPGTSAK